MSSLYQVFDQMGIEPQFWNICGPTNPFERQLFHEMTYHQRVWLLKSLCDFLLVSWNVFIFWCVRMCAFMHMTFFFMTLLIVHLRIRSFMLIFYFISCFLFYSHSPSNFFLISLPFLSILYLHNTLPILNLFCTLFHLPYLLDNWIFPSPFAPSLFFSLHIIQLFFFLSFLFLPPFCIYTLPSPLPTFLLPCIPHKLSPPKQHNHKTVQEVIAEHTEADQREYHLGRDRDGNEYLHFPQFCGQDLRIYRRAQVPSPEIKVEEEEHKEGSILPIEKVREFKKMMKRIRSVSRRGMGW